MTIFSKIKKCLNETPLSKSMKIGYNKKYGFIPFNLFVC